MINKKNTKNKLLSVFRKKSLSIYQLILILLILSSIISIGLISAAWTISETYNVKNEISVLREKATNKQKEELKAEVSRLLSYLNHVEQDTVHHTLEEIQDEILTYFEDLRFGNDGYVFVNTYDGRALLFDGKKLDTLKIISNMRDPNGIQIFQIELDLAHRPDGGFFEYEFKKLNDSITYPKMSYVNGFDKWEWIVGAGDYLDNLENEIALMENELQSNLNRTILSVIGVFVFILLLLLFLSTFVAKSIQNQFYNLVAIIKQSSADKQEKGLFNQIYIRELKTIGHDIANAEELVRQFGNIIDKSQNEIYIFNQEDLRFVHANEGACKNCGYSIAELQKRTPLDLASKLNKAQFLDLLEPLKQKDQTQFETVLQRRDKSLYPVEVHMVSSVFNTKPVFVAFLFDISKRKAADEIFQKRKMELLEAQRIGRIGSWYLDLVTNEVVWTEELYRMYNFDPTLPPPPYTEHQKLFTPESWSRLSKAVPKTSETGIPYELELENIRSDGSNGWLLAKGETVKNENGIVVGLRGVAQDITERKQAEVKLREIHENLEELVKERTSELEKKNKLLEEINNAFVGRELRMKELKEEIEKLKNS